MGEACEIMRSRGDAMSEGARCRAASKPWTCFGATSLIGSGATMRHVEDNSKRALWGVPAAGPKATTPKDTPTALAHLPPDRPVVLVRIDCQDLWQRLLPSGALAGCLKAPDGSTRSCGLLRWRWFRQRRRWSSPAGMMGFAPTALALDGGGLRLAGVRRSLPHSRQSQRRRG